MRAEVDADDPVARRGRRILAADEVDGAAVDEAPRRPRDAKAGWRRSGASRPACRSARRSPAEPPSTTTRPPATVAAARAAGRASVPAGVALNGPHVSKVGFGVVGVLVEVVVSVAVGSAAVEPSSVPRSRRPTSTPANASTTSSATNAAGRREAAEAVAGARGELRRRRRGRRLAVDQRGSHALGRLVVRALLCNVLLLERGLPGSRVLDRTIFDDARVFRLYVFGLCFPGLGAFSLRVSTSASLNTGTSSTPRGCRPVLVRRIPARLPSGSDGNACRVTRRQAAPTRARAPGGAAGTASRGTPQHRWRAPHRRPG